MKRIEVDKEKFRFPAYVFAERLKENRNVIDLGIVNTPSRVRVYLLANKYNSAKRDKCILSLRVAEHVDKKVRDLAIENTIRNICD